MPPGGYFGPAAGSGFPIERPLPSLVGVSVLEAPAGRRAVAGNTYLVILFAIVHTAEVWNLAYQGRVWWFDCVVGLVMCGVAVARERNRLLAAAAGLSLAAGASAAAAVWHLPGEPGIATLVALTVLVTSAVRASMVGPLLTRILSRRQAAPGLAGPTERRGTDRLAGLISHVARRGIPVRLQVPDGMAWPAELTGTICQVVRQALINVTRHGTLATAVTVTVTRDQDTVTVEVADDAPATGDRASSGSGRSHGPPTIREHVESLGGSYWAGPDPGCGWSVRATMPVGGPRAGQGARCKTVTPANRQLRIGSGTSGWSDRHKS